MPTLIEALVVDGGPVVDLGTGLIKSSAVKIVIVTAVALASATAQLWAVAEVGEHAAGLARARADLVAGRFEEAEGAGRALAAAAASAQGDDSFELAQALDIIVEALWRQGRFYDEETRELAQRAVALKERRVGRNAPEMVSSLTNLANVSLESGARDEARQLYEEALGLAERSFGPDHPAVARVLDGIGILHRDDSKHTEARAVLERALEIKTGSVGRLSAETVVTLHHLARARYQAGDAPAALALHEETVAIAEQIFPPRHPELARVMAGLGFSLAMKGELQRARDLLDKALEITHDNFGERHPQSAAILRTVGILHRVAGEDDEAVAIGERALAIQEDLTCAEHHSLLPTLDLIAWASYSRGDHDRARRTRRRAFAIAENYYGPENPHLSVLLSVMAMDLRAIGDYAAAEEKLRRAVDLAERASPPYEYGLAHSLTNLGFLLGTVGRHGEAVAIYERAVPLAEKVFGAGSPWALEARSVYAASLRGAGMFARAAEITEEVLAARREVLGPDHLGVARALEGLAYLHLMIGQTDKAIEHYREAVAILEKGLGADNYWAVPCSIGLARALAVNGEADEALALAIRAEDASRERLRLTARALPERQALRYASSRSRGYDLALSLIAAGSGQDRRPVDRVWDLVIRARTLVLDEIATRQRVVWRAAAPEIKGLADELAAARSRLASQIVRGPGSGSPDQYLASVEAATRELESLETAFAERSITAREDRHQRGVGRSEVRGMLPAGSALVAYVRYSRYQIRGQRKGSAPEGADASARPPAPVPSYLAFTLVSGQPHSTATVLGPAAEIDPLIEQWRQQVVSPPTGLRGKTDRALSRYRTAGARLREAIWDPVAAAIGDVSAVYVVPDGPLHLVNLTALPVGKERFLLETGPLVHYLTAEREIARSRREGPRGRGLLALGGPDFDADPKQVARVAAAPPESIATQFEADTAGDPVVYRSPIPTCKRFLDEPIPPVTRARAEAREISTRWLAQAGGDDRRGSPVVTLTGAAASESAFKRQSAGHQIIHVATHGFFEHSRCRSILGRLDQAGDPPGDETPRSTLSTGENPLLLSGLILAGANRREELGEDAEDGILTAAEIASLDLSGTALAVLSGCGTGLGELQAGEGVMGLRRAFRIAGVESLVMSLWRVEDRATRDWMRRFYELRLAGSMTAAAVRGASLTTLRDRRRAGRTTHPFHWGAFIAADAGH